MAPGQTSAHNHEFFGNRTTNKDSTYDSMIGQATTCSTRDDTAGYWVPTLLDGNQVIRAQSLLIYYRGCNFGPVCKTAAGRHIEPFPADLRMISDNVVPPTDPKNIIVQFPQCWDGVNLDSPDHRSHMAFASGSGCPSSHPVRVPFITEVVRYPVTVAGKTLSSGPMSTMHADFWNTWDQDALTSLTERCLNGTVDCGRIDS